MAERAKNLASRLGAASNARRASLIRDLANKRHEPNTRDLRPRIMRNWDATEIPVSGSDDDNKQLPEIHGALGRWPENSVPNIHWDLANPETWTYKRPFSKTELDSSPFTPGRRKITILLCPEKGWVFELRPRPDRYYMSLRCFKEAMTTAMKQDVPSSIWYSASVEKKHAIVLAYYRRTGFLPTIQNVDVLADWKRCLTEHRDNLEAVEFIDNQMSMFVTEGAARNMTRLKTIDLLGPDTMFAGLTYFKEKNLWAMNTTSRHIASMVHHLLPKPDSALFLPESPPEPAQHAEEPPTVPNMVPTMGPPMMQIGRHPSMTPMVPQMAPQMATETFQCVPQYIVPPAVPQMAQFVPPQYALYGQHEYWTV